MSDMVRTEPAVSVRKLRRILGMERGEKIGKEPIGTHDGEWRLRQDGQWEFWIHADIAAELAENADG